MGVLFVSLGACVCAGACVCVCVCVCFGVLVFVYDSACSYVSFLYF